MVSDTAWTWIRYKNIDLDYKLEKQHGNLDVDEGEYAISDLSFLRGISTIKYSISKLSKYLDNLPLIAKKQCNGRSLIGLDFDLKQFGHETESGAKFFFMNDFTWCLSSMECYMDLLTEINNGIIKFRQCDWNFKCYILS